MNITITYSAPAASSNTVVVFVGGVVHEDDRNLAELRAELAALQSSLDASGTPFTPPPLPLPDPEDTPSPKVSPQRRRRSPIQARAPPAALTHAPSIA